MMNGNDEVYVAEVEKELMRMFAKNPELVKHIESDVKSPLFGLLQRLRYKAAIMKRRGERL